MARSRELRIIIAGDADKLDREVRRAGNSLDKLGKQTRLTASVSSKGFSHMRAGATGAAAAMGGLVLGGKQVVDAASDVNESLTKNAALFGKYSKGIERFAKTTADSLGISRREALAATGTFGGLFSSLDIAQKPAAEMSKRLVTLAADLASFNNASPEEALSALRSGLAGESEPMRRFNAFLSEGRVKAEAYASGIAKAGADLTEQQKVQARYNLVLKDTEKAQGDFGRTSDGLANQQRKLRANFDDAKVALGDRLLPTVTKGIRGVNKFVDEMQSGTGKGGEFVDTLEDIADEVRPIVMWLGRATKNIVEFGQEHPKVAKLAGAVLGVGAAIKGLRFVSAVTGFSSMLTGGRAVMRKLVAMFAKQGAVAGAAAGTSAAGAEGLTSAGVFNKMRGSGGRLGRVMGKGLIVGVIAGVALALPGFVEWIEKTPLFSPKKLGEKLGKKLGKALGTDSGDGIGKLGMSLGGVAGGASGGLMGASAALRPIADLGASAGLRVSSGKRAAGGKTPSGGISYHGSGEAIDMAGSPRGMLGFFRAARSRFGSRLAELIYTPGGVGVKDGRPYRYSGAVAAQHRDHVHVALDLGRPGPGIGDGLGKFGATSYGPPWGGIQGTGVTATGVNLKGNPKVYGIAADPRVLKLGSRVKVNPNPFGYRGDFRVFDTGGAIKGRRIDFYDWRGRKSQLAWGHRTVAVSTSDTPAGGAGGGRTASGGLPAGRTAESEERRGSRLARSIAAPFFADRTTSNTTGPGRGGLAGSGALRIPGITSLVNFARGRERVIGEKDTEYGQTERRFGQTDEDLGTASGRKARLSELGELKKLRAAQLKRQEARLKALTAAVARYDRLIDKLRAQLTGKKRVRGVAAVKVREKLREYEAQRIEYAAEARSLGAQIEDTKLELGDLAKEAGEVAATPDTVPDAPEAGPSATDKLGERLSLVDLQERAGELSPGDADAQRKHLLQQALNGYFGGLDERQRLEVTAQLRDAQQAATEAQQAATQASNDVAAALRDVKASIDAQLAFGDRVNSITALAAVRALSDVMNGHMGQRVNARSQMPGSGALSRI
jgi:3D (Asp-Asp-Asp) domain-containing protein